MRDKHKYCIGKDDHSWEVGYDKGYQQGRQDALEELKPFFESFAFDWICDDLCGEFINPDSDESWCAEHCHNETGYECIKKWCELKQMEEKKNE